MQDEKTVIENKIFKGRVIEVFDDEVALPNGKTAGREYINHNGGVSVVAVNENNEVYLVRQFRYPYREEVVEIPAGKLEKGEDPLEAAVRELSEETGLKSGKIESLGVFYPSPGYTNEKIYMYLATELETGKQNLDEDEFLTAEKMPMSELCGLIMSGEIKDGKTIAAVLKAKELLSERK
jgi:ADP-ribose pyrophosphatase